MKLLRRRSGKRRLMMLKREPLDRETLVKYRNPTAAKEYFEYFQKWPESLDFAVGTPGRSLALAVILRDRVEKILAAEEKMKGTEWEGWSVSAWTLSGDPVSASVETQVVAETHVGERPLGWSWSKPAGPVDRVTATYFKLRGKHVCSSIEKDPLVPTNHLTHPRVTFAHRGEIVRASQERVSCPEHEQHDVLIVGSKEDAADAS